MTPAVAELLELAPAELLERALAFAGDRTPAEALEAQRQAEAARVYVRSHGERRRARAAAVLALALARRVGESLPEPAKGGRGQRAEDPLGLAARDRSDYRAAASVTEADFCAWIEDHLRRDRTPTWSGLVRFARSERARPDHAWAEDCLRRLYQLGEALMDAPPAFAEEAGAIATRIALSIERLEQAAGKDV